MTDETNVVTKPLAAGIGLVCLLIAVMIATQLFVGVVAFDDYMPVVPFTFVSNLVILPVLLFLATKFKQAKLPALVWLHVSMAVMILFFSQTYSPFTTAWSILVLVASTYYSWRGFIASIATLVVIGALYIALFPTRIVDEYSSLINYGFLSVLVIALTVFLSFLFVRVIMRSNKKNRDLANAQRSEQMQVTRLNTLLNSISDAVMTLNRYGRVTSQNAAAQVFFDTNQSLIGRDIDKILQLVDGDNKAVSVRGMIAEIKSSSVRDDLSVAAENDTRHLSIQISRIRSTFDDSEEYGVVLIIRDITKQKTLEEEKDEFISVTSHELRTPVAIAEGSLSNLLLLQERGTSGDKLRDAADAAHSQVVYLAKMINDLSTLSRAERGVGDISEVIDLNELLHNLYTKYTHEAEQKSLHLNLDAEANLPSVETSRLYLEEILQNFVTNSIKYTKEGSVTLGAKLKSDGYVEFFVSDTGIGISKSDLAHVFERFYRSEDYRTRESSGTGLGLYVVKKLADKLDTKVDVESRLNSGSRFSFVLPLKTRKLSAPQGAVAEQIADPTEEPKSEAAPAAQ